MSVDPNNGAAPAPAAAPAATPAPAPVKPPVMAGDDMVVERVNAAGRRELVPVAILRAEQADVAGGRRAQAEIQKMREDYARSQEKAQRWDALERQVQTDPDGAVENISRLARLAKGEDASAPATPSTDSDGSRRTAAPSADVADLRRRVHEIEKRDYRDDITRSVAATLDGFEVFRTNPGLRKNAERQLLAARVIDPNADLVTVATEIHTDLLDVIGGPAVANATQTRDTRQERRESNPSMPVGVGGPVMPAPDEKATAADLNSSSWIDKLAKQVRRATGGRT